MQVRAIGNHVTDVDADPKPDGPVEGLILIIVGQLLLHLDREAHRPVNAIKHDEQRVASGLSNPPAMLADRRVD
jgi:hypothetical protein